MACTSAALRLAGPQSEGWLTFLLHCGIGRLMDWSSAIMKPPALPERLSRALPFRRSLKGGEAPEEAYPLLRMERSFESQNHTKWYCRYHIVIVPKYRKHLLFAQARVQIGKMLRDPAKQKESEIIEGHALSDHIHMVLSIPPKYSVSHVIGFLKGKTAILSHRIFARRRNPATPKHFWSRGYFVSSVGLDEDQVRQYVRDQWKHDKYPEGEQLDLRWE